MNVRPLIPGSSLESRKSFTISFPLDIPPPSTGMGNSDPTRNFLLKRSPPTSRKFSAGNRERFNPVGSPIRPCAIEALKKIRTIGVSNGFTLPQPESCYSLVSELL